MLFTRLAAIAQGDDNVEQYFGYEMTLAPMALFKNDMMRKPDKASLRENLLGSDLTFLKDSDQCNLDFNNCIFSVDGGALLNRVQFKKQMKFREIAMLYVNYVRKHYRSCFIVFDGYETATTKASERTRRQEGKKAQAVIIDEDNEVPYSQVQFLANEGNKTQLIRLISKFLVHDGQMVYQCKGDADTMIVSTSLQLAKDKDVPVVVVADDTDVAVMLLYHWNESMQDIYFVVVVADDTDVAVILLYHWNESMQDIYFVVVVADDTDVAVMLLYHWNESMQDIYFVVVVADDTDVAVILLYHWNESMQDIYFVVVVADDTDVAVMLLYHWNESMQDIYFVVVVADDTDVAVMLLYHWNESMQEIYFVVVVADDTDVTVMLLYHWNESMQDIYFHQGRGNKTWSIKKASGIIAKREHLLFVHAWSGCDTSSSTLVKESLLS